MPFDNEISGTELASLVALRRLIDSDRNMLNTERVLATFRSGRGLRLANAIIDGTDLVSAQDVADLAVLTKLSGVASPG